MPYKISHQKTLSPEELRILYAGIADHAKKVSGQKPFEPFAYLLRDEKDELKGGCQGGVIYGSLHVDTLWVSEDLRGQGYGKKLMELALQYGQEKACTFATVNTMSWEALDFYKKLGFEIEFERKGFQKNAIFYFLRKNY